MTIQIQLTSAAELGLTTLARMKGLRLDEYVQGLLESLATSNSPTVGSELTPEELADAFQTWVRTFPYRRKIALPDEAIHRESIYRRASNE